MVESVSRPVSSSGVAGLITSWPKHSSLDKVEATSPTSPTRTAGVLPWGDAGPSSQKARVHANSPLHASQISCLPGADARRDPAVIDEAVPEPVAKDSPKPALPVNAFKTGAPNASFRAGTATPTHGPQVGPDKDKGMQASDVSESFDKAVGLGSRKQRVVPPGKTDGLVTCLTAWDSKTPASKRSGARSPGPQDHEARSRAARSPYVAQRDPPKVAYPVRSSSPNSMHTLHAPDDVPLAPFLHDRDTFPKSRRPRCAQEEKHITTHQAFRCDPEYYARSTSPHSRSFHYTNNHGDTKSNGATTPSCLQGKAGLLLGSTRRVRSPGTNELEDKNRSEEHTGFLFCCSRDEPTDESDQRGFRFSLPAGPKDAAFNVFQWSQRKRPLAIPGETSPQDVSPAPSPDSFEAASEPAAPSKPSVPAAGVASPRYDQQRQGVLPRSADDTVFRAETKIGMRKLGIHSRSSGCETPPSAPRDMIHHLASGLGPTSPSTSLCWHSFLGERRRKSPGASPFASPSASPFASPLHSPRGEDGPMPAGLANQHLRRGFGVGTFENERAGTLPSWSAVATFSDGFGEIGEGVVSNSPVPRWNDGPVLPKEERDAAVQMHRHASPLRLGNPVALPKSLDARIRRKENNMRKADASSKGRWNR